MKYSLRFKDITTILLLSSLVQESYLNNYNIPTLVRILGELDIISLERIDTTKEQPSNIASSSRVTSSIRPTTPPPLGSLDSRLRELSLTPKSTTLESISLSSKRLRDTSTILSIDNSNIQQSPTKYRPTKRLKEVEDPSLETPSLENPRKTTSILGYEKRLIDPRSKTLLTIKPSSKRFRLTSSNLLDKDLEDNTTKDSDLKDLESSSIEERLDNPNTLEDSKEDIIGDFLNDTIDDTIEDTIEDINIPINIAKAGPSKEPIFKKPSINIDITTTEEYRQFQVLEREGNLGLVKSNIPWTRLPTTINLDRLKKSPKYSNIGRIIKEIAERVLNTCLICLKKGEPNKNKHSTYTCPSLITRDKDSIEENYLITRRNIGRRAIVESKKSSSNIEPLDIADEFNSECFLPYIICYYFRDTLGSSKRCYIGLEFFTFIYYLYRYKLGKISRVFYLVGAKDQFLNFLSSNEKRIESLRPISKALFIFLLYIDNILVKDIKTS